MRAVNPQRGTVLAWRVERADGFWRRLRGLMFRPPLPPGAALLLVPCRQVHTFWMRCAIDVVFLDRRGRVVAVLPELAPGRIGPRVGGAHAALELPAGTAAATRTAVGDEIRLEPCGGPSPTNLKTNC